MPNHSSETSYFINQLDAAVEAHMDWVRRSLRSTVFGKSPSEEVLNPLAHSLCQFGRWFALNKPHFEKIDAQKVQRLDVVHQNMHDAIRGICTDLLANRGGQSADLDTFEQTQSELVILLAEFKAQVLDFPTEPLPWALTWSEQLSVDIPEIDAEHRYFIQLANEFNEAVTGGKGLAEIQKCTQAILDDAGAHFYHEECLFKKWGYPKAKRHAQIHAKILIELSNIMGDIQGSVESEWINAGLKIKRILIEHMLTEDMQYRIYCQKQLTLPL